MKSLSKALLVVLFISFIFVFNSTATACDHAKTIEVKYKGKSYKVCSADCKAKFEKDPEAFIKKMKECKHKCNHAKKACCSDKKHAHKAHKCDHGKKACCKDKKHAHKAHKCDHDKKACCKDKKAKKACCSEKKAEKKDVKKKK